MSDQAQFEGLLLRFTDDNNEIRNQAEQLYHKNKRTHPNETMCALIQIACASANADVRGLAALLLRRAFLPGLDETSFWKSLKPETQLLLQQQLLEGVEREADSKVRGHLCDAVSSVIGDLFAENAGWSGFVEWLLKISHLEPHHRRAALSIFTQTATYLKGAFKGQNFKHLLDLLKAGLTDPNSSEVRLAGTEALAQAITTFTEQIYRKELQALIPTLLDALAGFLNSNDQNKAQEAIKQFVEITGSDPGYFRPFVANVVGAMFNIASAKQLEEGTRQISLEFLISLVENKASMCVSINGFAKSMVDLLLQFILEIPEFTIEEWNETDENEDAGDVDNSTIGQEGLDRICEPIGGKIIAPLVFAHLPGFVQHQSWEYRYTGLMALSMIAEGCNSVLSGQLPQIVALILPAFDDPHPRVRWAAANATGQLSTDFGPKLQKHHHGVLLPKLISLLDDSQNPKVQSHTAAAFVNFTDTFTTELLEPYLDVLLQKILQLLKTPNKMVQEQALTALASIAGCAQTHFTKYYTAFSPLLKDIMSLATSEEQRMMRSKAMECFSIIGDAVGKDVFKADVHTFMDLLASISTAHLGVDDPQRDFVLEAWVRISTTLGQDFVPYLKFVVPPLIQTASIVPQMEVSDASVVLPEDKVAQHGWEVLDIGNQIVKVHTVALEEKASACSRLLCFAHDMKDGFFPYVEEVSKLMHPLMLYTHHDGIRISAISIVPALIKCAKRYEEKHESVRTETEFESLVYGFEAITRTLSILGPNSLTQEDVSTIMHDIYLQITCSVKRCRDLAGSVFNSLASNPDQDSEHALRQKDEIEEEQDIATELIDLTGTLIASHPQFFMNGFKLFHSLITSMIQEDRPQNERQFALCIFDDVIEHGKELSFPYWEEFMPFFIKTASDPSPSLRQTACFGLGVAGQVGGELFIPLLRPALHALIQAAQNSSEDDKELQSAENAVSSIGKLIKYQTGSFSATELQEIVNLWVNRLPLEADQVEATVAHGILVDLMNSKSQLIFGPQLSNLPKILIIFATIMANPDLVEEIGSITSLLEKIQKDLPPSALESAFAMLPLEHQHTLKTGPSQPLQNK